MNATDLNTSQVNFGKERGGYDRQQVDSYVELLGNAYEQVSQQYITLQNKYKALFQGYHKLKTESSQRGADEMVITKTLIDAEMMAQKIIATAQAEAERIRGDACIEKAAVTFHISLRQ